MTECTVVLTAPSAMPLSDIVEHASYYTTVRILHRNEVLTYYWNVATLYLNNFFEITYYFLKHKLYRLVSGPHVVVHRRICYALTI